MALAQVVARHQALVIGKKARWACLLKGLRRSDAYPPPVTAVSQTSSGYAKWILVAFRQLLIQANGASKPVNADALMAAGVIGKAKDGVRVLQGCTERKIEPCRRRSKAAISV